MGVGCRWRGKGKGMGGVGGAGGGGRGWEGWGVQMTAEDAESLEARVGKHTPLFSISEHHQCNNDVCSLFLGACVCVESAKYTLHIHFAQWTKQNKTSHFFQSVQVTDYLLLSCVFPVVFFCAWATLYDTKYITHKTCIRFCVQNITPFKYHYCFMYINACTQRIKNTSISKLTQSPLEISHQVQHDHKITCYLKWHHSLLWTHIYPLSSNQQWADSKQQFAIYPSSGHCHEWLHHRSPKKKSTSYSFSLVIRWQQVSNR